VGACLVARLAGSEIAVRVDGCADVRVLGRVDRVERECRRRARGGVIVVRRLARRTRMWSERLDRRGSGCRRHRRRTSSRAANDLVMSASVRS